MQKTMQFYDYRHASIGYSILPHRGPCPHEFASTRAALRNYYVTVLKILHNIIPIFHMFNLHSLNQYIRLTIFWKYLRVFKNIYHTDTSICFSSKHQNISAFIQNQHVEVLSTPLIESSNFPTSSNKQKNWPLNRYNLIYVNLY